MGETDRILPGLRISVVVPTFERPDRVARLVRLLDEQTLAPESFEAIIVDDGSRVDPTPAIEAAPHRYRLIVERQANQGAAAARNRGIARASAPVVLCLDDDMIPCRELLEEHLRIHDSTPRAVIVGRIRTG